MADEVLIKVEGVRKKFCRSLKRSLWYGVRDMAAEMVGGSHAHDRLRPEEFWAMNDVSFEVRRGECLGLIGRNGAGKTSLLKMLNGLIKPDHGRIEIRGRVGALIALGAGFSSILTGRENIYINGSVLGLTQKEIDAKLEEIIDFADIREFIDAPVQSYSSGMQVRLGFSVATALNPDILLVDEVLAVGDFKFRWKCLERIKQLKDRGVCIILVSHNSADLMRTCTRGHVLQRGETQFDGDMMQAILGYEGSSLGAGAPAKMETGSTPSSAASIASIRFRTQDTKASTMKHGESVEIEVEIQAPVHLPKARVVIALFHSEQGPLFHLSSYLDNQWIELKPGRNRVTLTLEALPLQFGSYYAEVTLRGPELGDIYDYARSPGSLLVTEPIPNYEGFGVNGVLLPDRKWTIN